MLLDMNEPRYSSTNSAGNKIQFSGDFMVFIIFSERSIVHDLNICNIKIYYKQNFRSQSTCKLLTGGCCCIMACWKMLFGQVRFFVALPRLATGKESLRLHVASQVSRSRLHPVVYAGGTASGDRNPEVKFLVSCCILCHEYRS